VAVVSPREERRNSARAWAPLLRGRAEIRLCTHVEDAGDASVIALDAACPGVERWIERVADAGRAAVVLFGSAPSPRPGALPWGQSGEEVLAAISDLLDRQRLVGESDDLLEALRASSDRLRQHRGRLADLSRGDGDGDDDRAALARDVERLTRVAAVARFLSTAGPEDGFADRFGDVLARALGAGGVALARREGSTWTFETRRRLSAAAARRILPDGADADRVLLDRPCAPRPGKGFWLPLGDPPATLGLLGVARPGRDPLAVLGEAGLEELRALVAESLTAREASAALFRRRMQSERVVQTLRSGLLKVDAEERVVLANPALAAMLETEASRLEGRLLPEALPRDPHVVEMLRGALARGEPLDDVETFVTSTGGRRVAVSLRASTLGGDGTRAEGALVLLSDLARRKELEEEVRKAERLAALGRLSAGVAHEIRNPLAGIRTTAELLHDRLEQDADLVRFVDVILEETERLDRIVSSLLRFAKPSAPRRMPVQVVDLLERAARLAAGRASERGVALRVCAAPPLPEAPADRDQLMQVLLNLLLNAIDATPPGGEVVVRAEATGEELRLVVEDGGAGVPASLRDRVFDPFFTTKPGGTGLGLSISQNILQQHGGRLRLERPDGGRSRAVATLPLRAPDPKDALTGGATWRTS
jgi:signal transduction histidine kinase